MILSTAFLALCGMIDTLYLYYVEYQLKNNPYFKPVCDLSDKISCTKPIKSPYSNMLGISNGLAGVIFYSIVLVASLANLSHVVFALAIASCIASLGLAYLLFFKIKSLCLVCTTIYIINIALLIASYRAL